jgi:low temperature requirement protein LtrA
MAADLLVPQLACRYQRALPPERSHLPERFGLFLVIVLGESITAVVVGLESK